MKRTAFLAGAIYGFLGVALGAFGAHALEDLLEANGYVEVFETGTRYHMIHALLLLAIGLMLEHRPSRWLNIATFSASIGIPFFAGSLYLLSTLNLKWMGAITPIGGLCFLIAWACIFLHFFQKNNSK